MPAKLQMPKGLSLREKLVWSFEKRRPDAKKLKVFREKFPQFAHVGEDLREARFNWKYNRVSPNKARRAIFLSKQKVKTSKALTSKSRNSLSAGAFVFPDERRYPIHDESHARNALARASGKSEESKVRAAVHAKYPGIGKTSSVHFCKECGKTHRPKCDECGSTRDLRSYHGPCGSCAFKKESQVSFLDELQKIAGWDDFVGYAGQKAQSLKRFGGGVASNVGGALSSFATPRESFKKGWEATWRPGGQTMHPLSKALMAYGAYNDVKQIAPQQDPTGQGRSRIHRALTAVGSQAGGIMSAPYGLSGGIVGGMTGAKLGDLAGRAIDKVRGFKRVPQAPHLPPRPVGQQE